MSAIYSVGKKIIMALSGLFLISFLIAHLSGNFLLFANDGGEAFDAYAEFMSTNPFIRVLEIGLFAGFIIHIVDGIVLSLQNRKARPDRYAVKKAPPGSSWFSRNMGVSGSIVFIFLVIHLRSFFVESRFIQTEASLYNIVQKAFENPLYSAFYIVAMVLLAFHLSHGFKSAFQTLGLRHRNYFKVIEYIGYAFAIVVPAAFASMPIYFYIKQFM